MEELAMNPVTAAALGAGLMYLFDPEEGQARRTRISEKCQSLTGQAKHEFNRSVQDLEERTQQCASDMRSAISEHQPARALQAAAEQFGEWTPATKLLAAVGGGAVAAYALAKITPSTLILGGLGAGLCAAVMNSQQLQDALANAITQAEEHAELEDQSEESQVDAAELPANAPTTGVK
jgi:hypothetical protein